MSTTPLRRPLITAIHAALRPLGYRRCGALFMRPSHDVVHLIEVQGAGVNTAALARFTVNVGVFVPCLAEAGSRSATFASMPAAHWRERIGYLSPECADRWWTVSSTLQAQAAAEEIVQCLLAHAVRELNTLKNASALAALWASGRSPGLMASQRHAHLERLQGASDPQVPHGSLRL